MIHVYAFTPAGVRVDGIVGIDDAPVETCTVADVAAVVSDGRASGEATTAQLLAHGRVVEALRDRSDAVLPVRFGERLSRDDLTAALAEQLAEWRARLARVRGCVEFGVRTVPPEPIAPARNGTDYMRLRLAAARHADDLRTELERCARASHVGGDEAAAYLVAVEERPTFERVVAEFTAAHPDLTVLCTGPWAPYSFAEAT